MEFTCMYAHVSEVWYVTTIYCDTNCVCDAYL